ncbi:Ubiquitin thioesterase OTUB2 [Bienertia sinuspersici]
MGSVSTGIHDSIPYMSSAKDVWKHLERMYAVVNGARKYKLARDLYYTQQNARSINEYYIAYHKLWEMTPEVNALLKALNQQKEERRLLQFLTGLDDEYAQQRSQFLMHSPLPTAEYVCATLQQEETQREIQKDVN